MTNPEMVVMFRELADALENERSGIAEVLLVARLPNGRIISDTNLPQVQDTAMLARDYTMALAETLRRTQRRHQACRRHTPRLAVQT